MTMTMDGKLPGMEPITVPKLDRSSRIGTAIFFSLFVALAALTAALPPVQNMSDPDTGKVDTGDTAWVLTSSCLVLFMTPGLALFYGGMVGHHNVISTMYQSIVSMGVVSVAWVILGFSLAFGKDDHGNGIIGYPKTFFMFNDVGPQTHPTLSPTVPLVAFSMFQLMFAIITPALIAGGLAERVNFSAYMIFLCVWHLIVYCPLAHLMWHPDGAFRKWGALDFAGGTVVEMASGFSALAGAYFIGPRKGPTHTPANIPFILLGTGIFWFGWLGFNSGSAIGSNGLASIAFATTNTAGASAMLTWIFLDFLLGKPTSAVGACNGIVVGLVAITPACGFVTVGSALVIGCLAVFVCYTVGYFMKSNHTSVDDSLDVFAVHGMGGLVGFLCTGIFCTKNINPAGADGLIYGQGMTLAKHIAIVLVIAPCIFTVTYFIFYLVDFVVPVRVSEEEEAQGLDKSMHSEEYGHIPLHSGITLEDKLKSPSKTGGMELTPSSLAQAKNSNSHHDELNSSNHSTSSNSIQIIITSADPKAAKEIADSLSLVQSN